MIVAYDIRVDGWTQCQTSRAPVLRGYGPVEISTKAWKILSLKEGPQGGAIPCKLGLTDTEHLIAVASYIDRQAET